MTELTARIAIGVALLLLIIAVLHTRSRLRRSSRHRQENPARTMLVHDSAHDVSGTIVSPPSLTSPLSKRHCSLWELALFTVHYSEEGDPGYSPVWVTGHAGDLVIEYDVRRTITVDPKTGGPNQTAGPGGRLTVLADQVMLRLPGGSSKPMPGIAWMAASGGHRPADVELLRQLGLPEDLLAQVKAGPAGFAMLEGALSTGQHVRLTQMLPGGMPRQGPYYVYPLTQETMQAVGAGCLGALLLLLAIAAAVAALITVAPLF